MKNQQRRAEIRGQHSRGLDRVIRLCGAVSRNQNELNIALSVRTWRPVMRCQWAASANLTEINLCLKTLPPRGMRTAARKWRVACDADKDQRGHRPP